MLEDIHLFDKKAYWNSTTRWHVHLVFIKSRSGEKINIKSKENIKC